MIWIVETEKGGFEAQTKRQIISDMVEYFGESEGSGLKIQSIICILKNGKEKKICDKVFSLIQEIVEHGVQEYIQIAEELKQEELEKSRDYFLNQV